ncbi:MAG: Trm112 family protein [Thiomicrorhabdus chilensis]|uniref:Trm112 family protein n=1 Tax=Thiomicrorhabdus chilensis TaxID=63656 RepID=UPI0004086FC6|nr:Trm112 family protein [Thiomicrorhabdus chilensis]MDX1348287.1 Trm112 family protein [Thiomicrorhabdus chilensis]
MDPKLLEILVCPVSKTKLIYDKSRDELISTAANLAYPVRDGIPILLEDEARQITAEEAEKYRSQKA